MPERKKILILYNGLENGTSARLMKKLADFISGKHYVSISSNRYRKGVYKIIDIAISMLRPLPRVVMSDVVICHSYATLSFTSILLAKILRKKVLIIAWDVYPISINGDKLNKSIYRSLFDGVEKGIYFLADKIILPSSDFEKWFEGYETKIISLWNTFEVRPIKAKKFNPEDPIKVVFAGHIDETRGIFEFFNLVSDKYRNKFIFHHAGSGDVASRCEIEAMEYVSHGNLNISELEVLLGEMDMGLVSLNPHLDQPGFPSKTFDYLAQGLPVLYFGPKLDGYLSAIKGTYINASASNAEDIGRKLKLVLSELEERRNDFYATTTLRWSDLDSCI